MEKLQQLRIQHWCTMYLEIAKKLEGDYTPAAVKDGATLHANNALEAFDARFPQIASTGELGIMVDTENPWEEISDLTHGGVVEIRFADGKTDLGWLHFDGRFFYKNGHDLFSHCWDVSRNIPTHFREITQ